MKLNLTNEQIILLLLSYDTSIGETTERDFDPLVKKGLIEKSFYDEDSSKMIKSVEGDLFSLTEKGKRFIEKIINYTNHLIQEQ